MTTSCPYCQKVVPLSAAAFDGPDEPKDDDISMCIACGYFSIFDSSAATRLRVPTIDETTELMNNDQVQKLITAYKMVKGKI